MGCRQHRQHEGGRRGAGSGGCAWHPIGAKDCMHAQHMHMHVWGLRVASDRSERLCYPIRIQTSGLS